jgi:hypothetical protein
VCIARIAILDVAINLSTSRRHYDGCVSSNAKKIGGVVDLGASAICESVFFWPPRARVGQGERCDAAQNTVVSCLATCVGALDKESTIPTGVNERLGARPKL